VRGFAVLAVVKTGSIQRYKFWQPASEANVAGLCSTVGTPEVNVGASVQIFAAQRQVCLKRPCARCRKQVVGSVNRNGRKEESSKFNWGSVRRNEW